MILLVTTLDMASIKDTVLALEMLHERFGNDDERIKIVLNRAGMDTGVRERDVEATLDAPLGWRIPQDNEVVKAAQIGRPIVMSRPNSKVASEIRDMAQALSGVRRARGRAAMKRNNGMMSKLFPSIFKKSA
jgi:pilus assembly protein CpaE